MHVTACTLKNVKNLHALFIPIGGIPSDLFLQRKVVSVVGTIIVHTLGTIALILGIVCLTFNIIFRKRKYKLSNLCYTIILCRFYSYLFHRIVRLSSPNLNYVMITAVIVVVINEFLHAVPTDSFLYWNILCKVNYINIII